MFIEIHYLKISKPVKEGKRCTWQVLLLHLRWNPRGFQAFACMPKNQAIQRHSWTNENYDYIMAVRISLWTTVIQEMLRRACACIRRICIHVITRSHRQVNRCPKKKKKHIEVSNNKSFTRIVNIKVVHRCQISEKRFSITNHHYKRLIWQGWRNSHTHNSGMHTDKVLTLLQFLEKKNSSLRLHQCRQCSV